MDNKRRFKRVGIVAGVEVTPVGERRKYRGYAANLSWGGIKVYTTESLKVKSSVELKLLAGDDQGREWSEVVVGKVKWIHKELVTAAGIEFEGLAERRQPRLMAFLAETDKKM